jgi:putative oxidoreductase
MISALRKAGGWAPLPARIALGLIFVAHGSQKLFGAFGGYGLGGTAQFLGGMGFRPAMFWAVLLGFTEFFGGLGVLVGLLTRLASIGIAVAMIVAVATVHARNGFFLQPNKPGFEFNLALIGICISLILSGAGRLSLDALFSRQQPPGAEAAG